MSARFIPARSEAAAADLIFNDLPSFGRSGKLRSHRLVTCANIRSKKYLLPQSLANHPRVVEQPEHMMCIAETRCGGIEKAIKRDPMPF
ncbi:hypothetical protein CQ12_33455 [Bradyrhizobium jicamae]|uniref:Uncharacterized protein n=1 Tax=Bradyrhizobium jicamae TaxID=280332 RepID=A0A0R3LFN6_9BRAD|nr:hypothetical protein CQ12_33455 [Bradyrhizobium jicamae]